MKTNTILHFCISENDRISKTNRNAVETKLKFYLEIIQKLHIGNNFFSVISLKL